jgi:hypothetical protein
VCQCEACAGKEYERERDEHRPVERGRVRAGAAVLLEEWRSELRAAGGEAAGLAEGGLYVITVWDSKAQYERFVTERLVPAFGAAGVRPGPTTVTDVDVDTLYTRTNETANH